MVDIEEMIMALDKVTPGIASDETLLYGRSICDERIAAGICKRNFRCKKYLKINGTIGLSIRLGKLG